MSEETMTLFMGLVISGVFLAGAIYGLLSFLDDLQSVRRLRRKQINKEN